MPIHGAGHNDVPVRGRDVYLETITHFVGSRGEDTEELLQIVRRHQKACCVVS